MSASRRKPDLEKNALSRKSSLDELLDGEESGENEDKKDIKNDTKKDIINDTKNDTKNDIKKDIINDTKNDIKKDIIIDTKKDIKIDTKKDIKKDTKVDIKIDIKKDIKIDIKSKRPKTGFHCHLYIDYIEAIDALKKATGKYKDDLAQEAYELLFKKYGVKIHYTGEE